jgi:hypothetical protein
MVFDTVVWLTNPILATPKIALRAVSVSALADCSSLTRYTEYVYFSTLIRTQRNRRLLPHVYSSYAEGVSALCSMRAMLLPVWVGKGSRAEKLCMHEALAECVRRWCGVAGIGSRVPNEDALGRRMGGCGGWVFCAEGLRYMKCVSAFKSAVSRYSDRTMRGLCCGVLLLRMSKQGAIAEPHPNRPRHPPDLQSS